MEPLSLSSRIFGPAGPAGLSDDALADLPRGWMTAACMNVRFRRAEGWLGLKQCESAPTAFTCRIAARPGVYGLLPISVNSEANLAAGTGTAHVDYALCYFPGPDDPMLDRFGLFAAVLAVRGDTGERLRDFPVHQDLVAAFAVARLRLAVARDGSGLGLSVTAERRRRVFVEEGIATPDGAGYLVAPGGMDEDLPAFELARDIVSVLAAGLTVASQSAPASLAAFEAPSSAMLYRSDGTMTARAEEGAFVDCDRIVWGEAQCLVRDLDPPEARPRGHAGLERYNGETMPVTAVAERDDPRGWRPRLIVLSGFLGSGKTSFLNQFIEYHVGRNELVTVIQNEIGETGVDEMLLEGDESVLAVDAGCVCCTLAGALGPAIQTLKARFRPEIIVLETTGLANPLNMIDELRELDDLVQLDAVVTVVDASRFHETLAHSDIALGQITSADTLVVNKCDLVDEAALEAIRTRLVALNPAARRLETTQGRINPKLLSEGFSRFTTGDAGGAADNAKGEAAPAERHHGAHGHHHDDTHDHCHDHVHDQAHDHASHLGEGFSFLKLHLPETVDFEVLSRLLVDCPREVDRVKGVVRLAGDTEPQILQFVPGHAEFVEPEKPIVEAPFLIVIGRGVDSPRLSAFWQPLMEASGHVVH